MAITHKTPLQAAISSSDMQVLLSIAFLCVVVANVAFFLTQLNQFRIGNTDFKMFYTGALVFKSAPGARLYDYDLYVPIQQRMFPLFL